jgi:starvation-inducible DNA-binding protein
MQELVDLSLIGKQLHWAVVGHAFRAVHEQLDELVASWRDLADVVAERAVALGYVPDGQARAVAAGSPLAPVAAEATESHAVVRAITDRIAQVSEAACERMDRIAERDAVSQDVLIDVVQALEHQQWMLPAQLSDRAGAVPLSWRDHPTSGARSDFDVFATALADGYVLLDRERGRLRADRFGPSHRRAAPPRRADRVVVAILTSPRRAWHARRLCARGRHRAARGPRRLPATGRSGVNGGITAGSGCMRLVEPGELACQTARRSRPRSAAAT